MLSLQYSERDCNIIDKRHLQKKSQETSPIKHLEEDTTSKKKKKTM